METEYLQVFDKFHKEKLSFLSGKEKHRKCKGCEKIKKFSEKDNELIFSCGSTSGECGQQIKIQLPKYNHFNDKSIELHKNINGSYDYSEDIQDIKGYNLETLNRYMKIKSELDDQNKLVSESKEEYSKLKKEFIKLNESKERMKDIQDLYQLKRKETLYKDKLMRELKKETTSEERKKDIRREYARSIIQNQKDILPLFKILRERNQMEIMVEDPIVESTIQRKEKKKKTKKDIKIDKKELDKIDEVMKEALKGVKIEREEEDPRGYEMCKRLAENKISKEDIEKYREKIKKKIVKKVGKEITLENYKSLIGDKEMKYMFELYDKYFFKNELSKLAKELDCMWTICWNHRCTKVSGKQYCDIKGKCKAITIELSSKVFKNVIDKMIKEEKEYINMDDKNRCDSVLSCMVLTFEHELVHGLQTCFCWDWKTSKKGPGSWTGRAGPGSGHSKTFMSILNNTFGHVDYQHSLFSAGHKEESPKPKVEEPPKKKGLGDELEELQVEILKNVSEAEQKKKLKGKAKPEKKPKQDKGKKLTPQGKEWVRAASEDMAERTKSK